MVTIYGEQLRFAREVRGLTRKQLAGMTGVDGNDLRRWEETERAELPADAAFRVMRELNFPIGHFREEKYESFTPSFVCGYREDKDGFHYEAVGERCIRCGKLGDIACDYPMGRGRTCDLNLCRRCAVIITRGDDPDGEQDIDYCPQHALMATPRLP